MHGGYIDNFVAAVLSLLLHAVVGVILIFNFSVPITSQSTSVSHEQMIQAVLIDQDQFTAERERRKAEQEAQRRAAEEIRLKAQEEARRKAEAEAKRKAEEEARRKAEVEAERKAEEEARRKAEEEARRKADAEAKRKAEEEARRKAEAEAKRKAEEEARRKAEAEAKRKAEEEARRKAEEEARRKAEAEAKRKAEEARQLAEYKQQLQASLEREVRSRQIQIEIEKYKTLIKTRVERNWWRPPGCQKGLSSKIRIVLGPTDEVESVEIVESSGDTSCDRSVETAVYRAAPLPLPFDEEAKAAFRSFNLLFKPGG